MAFGGLISASITHDPAAPQATVQDQFPVAASATSQSITLSETPADATALAITLTTPDGTATIPSSQYTVSTSSSKSITVTFSSALAKAGTLTVVYAANHPLSGTYDFSPAGQSLKLSLERLDVNLPFAMLHASGLVFSYQTGNATLQTMLLGAKGVTLTLGPGSGNTAGIQLEQWDLGAGDPERQHWDYLRP